MSIFKMVRLLVIGAALIMVSCQANDEELYKQKMKDPINPVVKMETSQGTLYIELYKKEAPISVQNFINYSTSGYYSETIFHRVIKGFMIQGGGFESGMKQKVPNSPIKNEAANGLKNTKGTLSMARTNVVDSATSQFFVNLVDNRFLDYKGKSSYGYAVFGKVIHGLDVVDSIGNVKTTKVSYYSDVPVSDIKIINVTIIQK
jgi:cyclophilin family peptidyl-prolyl cis-trans isomerase